MLNTIAKELSHNMNLVKVTKESHRKKKHVTIPKYDKNMQKAFVKRLQDDSIISLPQNICKSIAKVKCFTIEYIKETEHRPINDNELIDFSDGELTIEDIYNFHTYGLPYVSLSSITCDENGELTTLDETISNGEYEKTEMNDILYESLNLIDREDKDLLIHAYGLNEHDECTPKQLSKMFHLPLEEVMKRLASATNSLKMVMMTMI